MLTYLYPFYIVFYFVSYILRKHILCCYTLVCFYLLYDILDTTGQGSLFTYAGLFEIPVAFTPG